MIYIYLKSMSGNPTCLASDNAHLDLKRKIQLRFFIIFNMTDQDYDNDGDDHWYYDHITTTDS